MEAWKWILIIILVIIVAFVIYKLFFNRKQLGGDKDHYENENYEWKKDLADAISGANNHKNLCVVWYYTVPEISCLGPNIFPSLYDKIKSEYTTHKADVDKLDSDMSSHTESEVSTIAMLLSPYIMANRVLVKRYYKKIVNIQYIAKIACDINLCTDTELIVFINTAMTYGTSPELQKIAFSIKHNLYVPGYLQSNGVYINTSQKIHDIEAEAIAVNMVHHNDDKLIYNDTTAYDTNQLCGGDNPNAKFFDRMEANANLFVSTITEYNSFKNKELIMQSRFNKEHLYDEFLRTGSFRVAGGRLELTPNGYAQVAPVPIDYKYMPIAEQATIAAAYKIKPEPLTSSHILTTPDGVVDTYGFYTNVTNVLRTKVKEDIANIYAPYTFATVTHDIYDIHNIAVAVAGHNLNNIRTPSDAIVAHGILPDRIFANNAVNDFELNYYVNEGALADRANNVEEIDTWITDRLQACNNYTNAMSDAIVKYGIVGELQHLFATAKATHGALAIANVGYIQHIAAHCFKNMLYHYESINAGIFNLVKTSAAGGAVTSTYISFINGVSRVNYASGDLRPPVPIINAIVRKTANNAGNGTYTVIFADPNFKRLALIRPLLTHIYALNNAADAISIGAEAIDMFNALPTIDGDFTNNDNAADFMEEFITDTNKQEVYLKLYNKIITNFDKLVQLHNIFKTLVNTDFDTTTAAYDTLATANAGARGVNAYDDASNAAALIASLTARAYAGALGASATIVDDMISIKLCKLFLEDIKSILDSNVSYIITAHEVIDNFRYYDVAGGVSVGKAAGADGKPAVSVLKTYNNVPLLDTLAPTCADRQTGEYAEVLVAVNDIAPVDVNIFANQLVLSYFTKINGNTIIDVENDDYNMQRLVDNLIITESLKHIQDPVKDINKIRIGFKKLYEILENTTIAKRYLDNELVLNKHKYFVDPSDTFKRIIYGNMQHLSYPYYHYLLMQYYAIVSNADYKNNIILAIIDYQKENFRYVQLGNSKYQIDKSVPIFTDIPVVGALQNAGVPDDLVIKIEHAYNECITGADLTLRTGYMLKNEIIKMHAAIPIDILKKCHIAKVLYNTEEFNAFKTKIDTTNNKIEKFIEVVYKYIQMKYITKYNKSGVYPTYDPNDYNARVNITEMLRSINAQKALLIVDNADEYGITLKTNGIKDIEYSLSNIFYRKKAHSALISNPSMLNIAKYPLNALSKAYSNFGNLAVVDNVGVEVANLLATNEIIGNNPLTPKLAAYYKNLHKNSLKNTEELFKQLFNYRYVKFTTQTNEIWIANNANGGPNAVAPLLVGTGFAADPLKDALRLIAPPAPGATNTLDTPEITYKRYFIYILNKASAVIAQSPAHAIAAAIEVDETLTFEELLFEWLYRCGVASNNGTANGYNLLRQNITYGTILPTILKIFNTMLRDNTLNALIANVNQWRARNPLITGAVNGPAVPITALGNAALKNVALTTLLTNYAAIPVAITDADVAVPVVLDDKLNEFDNHTKLLFNSIVDGIDAPVSSIFDDLTEADNTSKERIKTLEAEKASITKEFNELSSKQLDTVVKIDAKPYYPVSSTPAAVPATAVPGLVGVDDY